MANIIKRKVLLLAVTLLLAPATQAQEYIKEVVNNPSNFSIIREYKEDTRIIYSEKGDDKQFMMVTESGATATLMNLKDEMYIRDFEIMGDTLYCCGYRYLNQLYGFFGWIDLTSFPSSSIHGDFFSELVYPNRLDVFKSRYGDETHVVMTCGKYIVDARKDNSLYTSWSYTYAPTDSTWSYFDDVAVTENLIAASVRTDSKHGYVFCFNHPVPGNTFLINPNVKYHIGGNITSQIILENCESNTFVSACQRLGDNGQNIIEMRSYKYGDQYHRIVYMNAIGSTRCPVDMIYNRNGKELDLLTHESLLTADHYIYHIDSNSVFSRRLFSNHKIYSLDYLTTDSLFCIASGATEKGELRFIKYNPYNKGICSETYITRSLKKYEIKEALDLSLWCYSLEKTAIPIGENVEEKDIIIRCYYNMKKETEQ